MCIITLMTIEYLHDNMMNKYPIKICCYKKMEDIHEADVLFSN